MENYSHIIANGWSTGHKGNSLFTSIEKTLECQKQTQEVEQGQIIS